MAADDAALDALLRAADPGPGRQVDADAVLGGFTPSGRRARRWRRRLAALGGGLAVVLVAGLGAPAVANGTFAAWLGELPGLSGTEDAPNSAWIDLGEADAVELAPQLWDDSLPLPEGYDGEGVSRALVYLYRMNGGPALIQEATIAAQFEEGVRCLWRAAYAEAPAGSETAERTMSVLEDSADWTWTRDSADSVAWLEQQNARLRASSSAARSEGCGEVIDHVDWYVGR